MTILAELHALGLRAKDEEEVKRWLTRILWLLTRPAA